MNQKIQNQELTQKLVKELFTYSNGRLYWSSNGDFAGSKHNAGYSTVLINKKRYLSHRVVYLMIHGYLPDFIDHVNGDRRDNNICNLRPCTLTQNNHNRGLNKNNTSGAKGVMWCKNSRKWKTRIRANGKKYHFGSFDDKEVAEQVVRIERLKLHGEFANHG